MTTCVRSLGKDTKLAKEQARKDQTEQGCGIVEKELMDGRVAKEMTVERKEARRAPRAANLTGTVTGTNGGAGNEDKGKGKGKSEIRYF